MGWIETRYWGGGPLVWHDGKFKCLSMHSHQLELMGEGRQCTGYSATVSACITWLLRFYSCLCTSSKAWGLVISCPLARHKKNTHCRAVVPTLPCDVLAGHSCQVLYGHSLGRWECASFFRPIDTPDDYSRSFLCNNKILNWFLFLVACLLLLSRFILMCAFPSFLKLRTCLRKLFMLTICIYNMQYLQKYEFFSHHNATGFPLSITKNT